MEEEGDLGIVCGTFHEAAELALDGLHDDDDDGLEGLSPAGENGSRMDVFSLQSSVLLDWGCGEGEAGLE